jgi:hypothetical protein
MGKRDYRRHETKKPKKNAKKATITDILPPPVNVEVIKKKRTKEPKIET